MTVKEIVINFLKENRFDGLFNPGECACDLDGLMECGECAGDCQPGFKSPCPDECGEHGFHIGLDF